MTFISTKLKILAPILLLASFSIIGCGGGSGDGDGDGGGDGGTPDAAITILPNGFDFGLVTEGNLDEVAPRQFEITNTGTDPYRVSSIRLVNANPDEFILNERGGADPCNALTFSLSPGDSCTVTVRFAPRSFDSFSAALLVQTNDPNANSIARSLAGTYAPIESINVTVNQINACPRPELAAQAFVSVTDQGGFPVRDLTSDVFTLEEVGFGTVSNPAANPVGESGTNLALSIVMDYSDSITDFPSAVSNMQDAATLLVDAMQATDEADIIKFADQVQPMTSGGFTSDQAELKDAIEESPVGFSGGTAFYDATVAAIARIEPRNTDRKVVLTLTDGADTDSEATPNQTIMDALQTDVPVFTIGFGDVDIIELQALADATAGLFYNPAADANLQQVSQQLTNLLFKDQYVLTFVSALGDGESTSLDVVVEFLKDGTVFKGEGTKTILACPQT